MAPPSLSAHGRAALLAGVCAPRSAMRAGSRMGLGLLGLVLALAPFPARGQVAPSDLPAPPGVGADRFHLAVTPLFTVTSPKGTGGPLLSLSGRATVGLQVTPGWSAHISGLALSPGGLRFLGGALGTRYTF